MLFKQAVIFKLSGKIPQVGDDIDQSLSSIAFSPCPPSFSSTNGWVSPLGHEHGALVHTVGHHLIFCMRLQEKILPASVVRHEVDEKVKKIQAEEDRKVYQKEKTSIREELTMTLLPKAFSKYSQVYAYIDTKNQFLVINTAEKHKLKAILTLFKKSLNLDPKPYPLKKMSYLLAQWLTHGQWPSGLDVMQYAVLQDPNDTKRTVSAKQQDLFSNAIQSFIKDGHEVKAINLSWHHGIEFTLTDQLILKGIKYSEELQSASKEDIESKDQRFETNFIICAETFATLIPILLEEFCDQQHEVETASLNEEAMAAEL